MVHYLKIRTAFLNNVLQIIKIFRTIGLYDILKR